MNPDSLSIASSPDLPTLPIVEGDQGERGPEASEACESLSTLSAQAAALTGTLALVKAKDRPAYAAWVAERVWGLADRADRLEGGGNLSAALRDLARSLEGYALSSISHPGTDPSRLMDVLAIQEASARNAQLGEEYRQNCGGEK